MFSCSTTFVFCFVTFRCITVGASAMQIDPIDRDDYFAKNAEFSAWLRDSKGKFFNEMDSDETRALFGMLLALTGELTPLPCRFFYTAHLGLHMYINMSSQHLRVS